MLMSFWVFQISFLHSKLSIFFFVCCAVTQYETIARIYYISWHQFKIKKNLPPLQEPSTIWMCLIWGTFAASRLDVSRKEKLICLCARSAVSGWILQCPCNFGGTLSTNAYSFYATISKHLGYQIINRHHTVQIRQLKLQEGPGDTGPSSRPESPYTTLLPLLLFQVYNRYCSPFYTFL